MTIKVKYSDSYKAKMARIKRLPRMFPQAISGFTKRDILEIKKIFHDGIKNNKLGLDKLAETTIASKIRKGYSKPRSPLYGAGDDKGDQSYSNMLDVVKRGNTWVLFPSTRMHHSGEIRLSDLFLIHEHGAVIRQKRGDTTILIRIPPRPALRLSYRRFMIKKRADKKEQNKEVKKAITNFINDANDKKLKELQTWENRVEAVS